MTRQPLGQLMLRKGFVRQEQIDRALDEQQRGNHQKLLGELLVEMKCCTDDHVAQALADAYDLPHAKVTTKLVDPSVLGLLPAKFLDQNQVLPMFLVESVLTVALAEPANVFVVEEIERITGHRVQLVAATARDIRATLHAMLRSDEGSGIDDLLDDASADAVTIVADKNRASAPRGDSNSSRLLSHCILAAFKDGATDIHIEPGESELRVRFRIDGRLIVKLARPRELAAGFVAHVKSIAGLAADKSLPQRGGFRATIDSRSIELRVSTMPGRFGESIVIRVMDSSAPFANLEKLGFGYETLKQWRKLIHLPNGIVLVTGPAGSGKHATMYASIGELNHNEESICTIEQSIQRDLAGVNQFQVENSGLTIPAALRSLLDQDPDVIMVDDIPDAESARLVTQAALTGHLVLCGLRANDAPSAVTRLNHLGVEPYLIGATLSGALAQRLVRKLCPRCKEPVAPSSRQRRQIEKFVGEIDVVHKPRGCAHCRNLGFFGRIGIYELLVPDDNMLERINAGATLAEIREMASALGMRTMRHDGIEKVKAGVTTLEEVHRVTT